MTRRVMTVLAAFALTAGVSAFTATGALAGHGPGNQSHQKKVCGDDPRDHGDCGKGNAGDPGNGGGHENEDNGKGNAGDPGKFGKGHRY
jgi:hypothetical protein